ncbi:Sorting nexin-9 [Dermatophagoides farinae]|uniref:Sorting nexin-9 n=1 Tax=Dermatophagoides farinae TaxID=6954 RepID=A0A922HQW0_DERFA|nr:Sorting nexin-9 [Dermatophagoides farinae]
MKVIALYDFQAQPDTGEISITKDEMITVTRQDIGEGWWEGINSRGQKGLFPAEYVSPVADPIPATNDAWIAPSKDPKPTMLSFVNPTGTAMNNNNNNVESTSQPPQQFNNVDNNYDQADDADWGDDDWDDDDDSQTSEFTADYSPTNPPQNQIAPIHIGNNGNHHGNYGNKIGQPSIKKSINRFSHFVKSGGEDYILGLKTYNVNQNDLIHIVFDDDGQLKWAPTYFNVTVRVEEPTKRNFIAYRLTPSDTGIPVKRRYKHFDWLHERLQDKFTTIPIPSLPDKQISGRYQDDFIENRRKQLQSWVERICRHPVLCQSTVWKHFITCKDEKQWKNGKRRAEKDELVGGMFFLTIQIPENATIDMNTDPKVEQFARFIGKLDESMKNTYNLSQEMIKRYQSFYKREFSKMSSIFSTLSEAFETCPTKDGTANRALIQAVNNTSETYETIGKLFEKEDCRGFVPLSNLMHEYRGILTAWPEIYQVYKGSINKKREHKKARDEGRLDDKSLMGIEKRADVVTYATIAEMNHFEQERINDLNKVMREFLTGQLKLYQEIVVNIENALQMFPPTQ